jgi:hypothetical protein
MQTLDIWTNVIVYCDWNTVTVISRVNSSLYSLVKEALACQYYMIRFDCLTVGNAYMYHSVNVIYRHYPMLNKSRRLSYTSMPAGVTNQHTALIPVVHKNDILFIVYEGGYTHMYRFVSDKDSWCEPVRLSSLTVVQALMHEDVLIIRTAQGIELHTLLPYDQILKRDEPGITDMRMQDDRLCIYKDDAWWSVGMTGLYFVLSAEDINPDSTEIGVSGQNGQFIAIQTSCPLSYRINACGINILNEPYILQSNFL